MNAEKGIAFLLATHDPAIMERAPRVVRIADGLITGDAVCPRR